ncbi:hypothetical protein GGR58DRAFT_223181 [Xylaria digitata]|nr:hypothetical protein GGR58DRAFT_223181 [Xylaria digitata]
MARSAFGGGEAVRSVFLLPLTAQRVLTQIQPRYPNTNPTDSLYPRSAVLLAEVRSIYHGENGWLKKRNMALTNQRPSPDLETALASYDEIDFGFGSL